MWGVIFVSMQRVFEHGSRNLDEAETEHPVPWTTFLVYPYKNILFLINMGLVANGSRKKMYTNHCWLWGESELS